MVGGLPASGKSSLAASLAAELGLALIAKDAIKEALMDVLGLPADVEASRRLGRAAVMAMLTVARTSPGGVLDSTWYPHTLPVLRELQGPLIEVRCVVPVEVARRRYAERTLSRHAGHLDANRLDEELWDPVHARALGEVAIVTFFRGHRKDFAASFKRRPNTRRRKRRVPARTRR